MIRFRAQTCLLLGGALLLGACGKKGDLRPATGASMPPKAATAPAAASVSALLAPSSQQRPARDDDLVTKSAPLQPDRFDLPPPG